LKSDGFHVKFHSRYVSYLRETIAYNYHPRTGHKYYSGAVDIFRMISKLQVLQMRSPTYLRIRGSRH